MDIRHQNKAGVFPHGIIRYEYEPYTMQNVLPVPGEYYVCGLRQTLVKDKTANDNYYLLTLTALAQEIRRKGKVSESCSCGRASLPGFGGKSRNSKSICFGRNSLSAFSMKGTL